MVEVFAAAVATAIISTGSAAALAAARRSGETRDAVLLLQAQVKALDNRLGFVVSDFTDYARRLQVLEQGAVRLDSRVTALEAGVVDRRHHDQ
jgi:hypothetical protein